MKAGLASPAGVKCFERVTARGYAGPMIWEMILWLALLERLYEVQVLTVILTVSFGYELAGRGAQRVPLRVAIWQGLRSAAAVGALIAVVSRVIIGSAVSLVASQLSDLLLLVVVSMAVGAVWRLRRIRQQRRCADPGERRLLSSGMSGCCALCGEEDPTVDEDFACGPCLEELRESRARFTEMAGLEPVADES